MPSRPTWFWTSLFASVGVNAVMFTSQACWLYSQTKIYLPGYARGDVLSPIFIADPSLSSIPDTVLGDSAGKGDAADAMAGDEMMQARQGPQGAGVPESRSGGAGKDRPGPVDVHRHPGRKRQRR